MQLEPYDLPTAPIRKLAHFLVFCFLVPAMAFGQISSFPYQEGFESGFGDWTNSSGDDFDWTNQSGGTPTNGTGPNAAVEGSFYVYTEVNGNNNSSAILQTLLDLNGITDADISFQYHMLGNSIGSLFLEAYSGGSWNTLTSFSGAQQSDQTTWGSASASLSSVVGDTVSIRFRVATSSGSKGDIAVDDVEITVPCTTDGGSSTASDNVFCTDQTVTLTLSGSTGGSTIQWQQATNGVTYADIAAGTTAVFTTSTLSVGTIYYFRAEVTNGCSSFSDTTIVSGVGGTGTVSSFPDVMDFESGLGTWTNSSSDDFDWTLTSGGTPSNNTGPDAASEGSQYIFTESNNPNNPNKTAWLENSFDFSAGGDATLEFYYHMRGSNMGSLAVEVNGFTLWSISGEQQANSSDPFTKMSIDLSGYSGCNTEIIFKGETGSGNRSDMAIDSIGVFYNSTTWTGSTSTNWHSSGNWNNGVPSSGQDVTIPASATNYPVISAAAACKSLDLESGASLIISGTNTLTVSGNWNGQGSFTPNESTVWFLNENAAKTINLSGEQSFYNITSSESQGLTISSGSIALEGTLTLNAGTLTTNNALTFVSNADGTARLAELGSTASVIGSATVQRYIASTDGWVSMGTSVQNSTLADVDDDIITTGFTGSDYPSFGFNNIYTYDESSVGVIDSGWTAATNITNSFSPQSGTFVYFGTTTASSFDLTNTLYTGAVDFAVSYTENVDRTTDEQGWNLVANPYPSAIDWLTGSWTKTNMNNAIYVWNSSDQQYESFVDGVGANGGTSTIASSQAFWVQANAASPSLIITEDAKTSTTTSFRSGTADPDFIRIAISGSGFSDETVVRLESGADSAFEGSTDALKQFSINPNVPHLYSTVDGSKFAINTLDLPTDYQVVPLVATVASSGIYTLSFPEITTEGFDYELVDRFNSQTYSISEDTSMTFSLSDTTNSSRFNLIISPQISGALPIQLLFFQAKAVDGHVELNWKTATEINNDFFTIERSNKSQEWEAIAVLDGAGTSQQALEYHFVDQQPLAGSSYYRLKQTDFDGTFTYSEIAVVDRENSQLATVFPNPTEGFITVTWPKEETPEIQLLNAEGHAVSISYEASNTKGKQQINMDSLEPGLYLLYLRWPTDLQVVKVVKN